METEIFTCKYFKFGRNTTGLSQSHLRNFLACSIRVITRQHFFWGGRVVLELQYIANQGLYPSS